MHVVEIDVEEYIRLENYSNLKHEYVYGQMIVMTGGSLEHSHLATTISAQLTTQLEHSPCWVFSSDGRVRIKDQPLFLYPDVTVACEPQRDTLDDRAVVNPRVVVEVLSPTTRKYDEIDKLRFYTLSPSIAEYLLVSQDEPRVRGYRRDASGMLVLAVEATEGLVELPSIGCTLDLAKIYRRVFPARFGS